MAQVNNALVDGMRGAFGKEFVFRTRGGKTFISKYPDMSNVKPSAKQLKEKSRFSKAVKYAQAIIADPKKKAAYEKKLDGASSVYHAAIKEYLGKK
jgi:hypothetical protein